MPRVLPFCVTALLVFSFIGCEEKSTGAKPSLMKGKLTRSGQPLQVPDVAGRVQLSFYPFRENRQELVDPNEATVNPADGTFEIRGLDGKGIPPGKYRVVVRQWIDYPSDDALKGAYALDRTPLVIDVVAGEDIIIDLPAAKK